MQTFSDFIKEDRLELNQFNFDLLQELENFKKEYNISNDERSINRERSTNGGRLTMEEIQNDIKAIEEEFELDLDESSLLSEKEEREENDSSNIEKAFSSVVLTSDFWNDIPTPKVVNDSTTALFAKMIERNKPLQNLNNNDKAAKLKSTVRLPDGTYKYDIYMIIPNETGNILVGERALFTAFIQKFGSIPKHESKNGSDGFDSSEGFEVFNNEQMALQSIKALNKSTLKVDQSGNYINGKARTAWWKYNSPHKLYAISTIVKETNDPDEAPKFIKINVMRKLYALAALYPNWTTKAKADMKN